jgi:RNA-directed DNA polymerase
MAAESSAGATPSVPRDWHSIDWKKAHVNVRRLQARIVQAMKVGKWGKVQALQHLLTRSFSAKALAVKRVTENQGKNTPGVDKVIWQTPTTKEMAIQELRQRGYTALPLRRLYIPKANGKKRPLGIPTMKDRAMQALYLQSVDPIAETQADPNSYGFRKARSGADAIEQCHTTLAGRGAMAPCEFISLSFWYDAPLTSRASDRRHDPWQVYGLPSYSLARQSSWISPA